MTMNERQVESIRKEIAKYEEQLAKREAKLAKKYAAAEKLDAVERKAEWDIGEEIQPGVVLRTKENQKKIGAWFSLESAKDEVEETKRHLENAHKRLSKLMPKAEADSEKREQDERADEMESKFFNEAHMSEEEKAKRQAEYEAWVKWFKAECLKDGVVIDQINGWYINGTAKSGKPFILYGNSGYTERSRHCYTLRINKEVIFTSGEFSTCYNRIKR